MNILKLFKKRLKEVEKEIVIRDDLQLIKRKGDLYDVISQKRNATPDSFLRKTIKAHTFIFSRLLYLTLVYSRRIKNSFAPVEKIKDAQDEIREYLNLPVDLYRTKDIYVRERDKTVGLLYGDYHAAIDGKCHNPSKEDLIKNLKKIENFCSKYGINEIYIDEFFLRSYLGKEFLSTFKQVYYSDIMRHSDSELKNFLQVGVNIYGLKLIIAKLEASKFDNEYIYTFKDKINDQVVKDAIDTFKNDNDDEELLRILKSRLSLHINDEGTMRDRVYGKVYETYELGDTFLRVSSSDSNGNLISQNIISLYSYLGARDFSSLEERANASLDNQEINQMALLYLHLLGERPRKELVSEEPYSLYDYIYSKYITTKRNKKIPWIKTRLQRLAAEGDQFAVAFFSVILAIILTFILRFVPPLLPINSSLLKRYTDFLDSIKSTYGESYEMEKNLFGRLKQTIEKFLPKNMQEEILDYAQGEMESIEQGGEPKKVAEIEWFTEDERPLYFMNQYACRTHFYAGEMEFDTREGIASFARIGDCEPLFQIKVPIDKSDYEDDTMLHIPLEACPVGNEYTLAKIIIKDEEDESKCIVIDEEWYYYNLWRFTREEKKIFNSMESPMAYFVYGTNEKESQVSTQYNMWERDYTKEISEEEAHDAIVRGLGLDDDATRDEINEAIASKEYTKYPLYTPIRDIDEIEYYEKIAALDSIDINLAAVLTTVANDGFIYTVGYKNLNNDEYLLTDEAYVWAMNPKGEVIDFLANFTDEESSSSSNNEVEEQQEVEDWANVQDEKMNTSSKEGNDQTQDQTQEQEQNQDQDKKEWASEEDNHKIKEVLDKVRLWAKEHHVSYYVAAIIAVLIINKIFGRKIKLKLQFRNAYKTLEDENLARTYAELLEFIYGEKCSPREKTPSEMIELINNQFQALDDEKIDALLEALKPVIKESDNKESLKRVENLLRTIPFIKERKVELSTYYKVLEKVKRRL